jgi:hypothetical protein
MRWRSVPAQRFNMVIRRSGLDPFRNAGAEVEEAEFVGHVDDLRPVGGRRVVDGA